jgi:hypothetical protein
MDSKGSDRVFSMDEGKGERTNIVILMDGGGVVFYAE